MRKTALASMLLLAAVCASTALPVHAAWPARQPDPMAPGLSGAQRLQALLERVRLQQKELRTIVARFVQRRQSAMLVAPQQSTGTFSYAAPDNVRWEYQEPTPITVVIHGGEMTTWYRDLRRAETLKIGRYSNQIFKFLGASGSMDNLLEYFTVEMVLPKHRGDPYHLTLLPRYDRIKKRIRSMQIDIDSERFFPVHLEYQEADGDSTAYDFNNFQWNPPLPADRFALRLPPGVENRILDPGGAGDGRSPSRQ